MNQLSTGSCFGNMSTVCIYLIIVGEFKGLLAISIRHSLYATPDCGGQDTAIQGNILRILSIRDKSEIQCARWCMQQDGCMAFNYETSGISTHICELMGDKVDDACSNVVERSGFTQFSQVRKSFGINNRS